MKSTKLSGSLLLLTTAALWSGCRSLTPASAAQDQIRVILSSEVEWTPLNPARGDLAPAAGTLWGDRKGTEPTGFLLRPPRDFESPPHIHNVSYRGVVIKGVVHNDDPGAAEMWMPAGSFWTQPKGEVHVTSAQGTGSLAYIEIEQGPYLVQPSDEAFDSGERPVNVDFSNVVWLSGDEIPWMKERGVESAFLWGSPREGELYGSFIKLPAGFSGRLHSQGTTFRAVLIRGALYHDAREGTLLDPGSGFSSGGKSLHRIETAEETILYVRTDGKVAVQSNK